MGNELMRRPLFCLLGVLALCLAASEEETAELKLLEAMGAETFEKAGLNNLSAAQLVVLENWILKRDTDVSDVAVKEAIAEQEAQIEEAGKKGFGFLDFWKNDETIPKSLKGPSSIIATIPGKFKGWDRDTRFTLSNGQVWEVANRPSKYYIVLQEPEVEIRKAGFGGHQLEILETGRKVRVKRVK